MKKYPVVKKYVVDSLDFVPLQIGDTIPDRLWNMPLWTVNGPSDTIYLRDYRHHDLIVIDFWSTWCAPCVKSMDKWNKWLVEQEWNRLAFFGAIVFDQNYKVLPFVESREWTMPCIIGYESHVLNRYFFDKYVNSRIVWIYENKLLAITSLDDYDKQNIKDLLEKRKVNLTNNDEWTYKN